MHVTIEVYAPSRTPMKHVDLRSHLANALSLPRATALVQETGLRAVLFHVKAGEKLPEHQAPGAITLLCLSGKCTLAAGADQLELEPNVLASLGTGAPHSVVAHEDTLLLVAIADGTRADK